MKIYIGYDTREPAAYHVAAHSIMTRSSVPVEVAPLMQDQLRRLGLYHRPRRDNESTEFSITRFLVPHLCNYQGFAMFIDCDMLCRADISELLARVFQDPNKAVWVAKHNYAPVEGTKFLGHKNEAYPKKNWSSVMLFDCSKCRQLTPENVNSQSGEWLHRFNWTQEELVGSLPLEWNWLVGEYAENPNAKMLHYTLGGPWFSETRACDHADLWLSERDAMLGVTKPVPQQTFATSV